MKKDIRSIIAILCVLLFMHGVEIALLFTFLFNTARRVM